MLLPGKVGLDDSWGPFQPGILWVCVVYFRYAFCLTDRKPDWFPTAVWPVPHGLVGSRSWGTPPPDPRPGGSANSQFSLGPSSRLFSFSQSTFLPGLPSSCCWLSQEAQGASRVRFWARGSPEQPGHRDGPSVAKTRSLPASISQVLFYTRPKENKITLKAKISFWGQISFDVGCCFAFYFTYCKVNPFCPYCNTVGWTEHNSESHCDLAQALQALSKRYPVFTCKSLALQDSVLWLLLWCWGWKSKPCLPCSLPAISLNSSNCPAAKPIPFHHRCQKVTFWEGFVKRPPV